MLPHGQPPLGGLHRQMDKGESPLELKRALDTGALAFGSPTAL